MDFSLHLRGDREVLIWINEAEGLRTIAVVILTTVPEPADTAMCSQLSANTYLAKPVQLQAIELLARSIGDFGMAISN